EEAVARDGGDGAGRRVDATDEIAKVVGIDEVPGRVEREVLREGDAHLRRELPLVCVGPGDGGDGAAEGGRLARRRGPLDGARAERMAARHLPERLRLA